MKWLFSCRAPQRYAALCTASGPCELRLKIWNHQISFVWRETWKKWENYYLFIYILPWAGLPGSVHNVPGLQIPYMAKSIWSPDIHTVMWFVPKCLDCWHVFSKRTEEKQGKFLYLFLHLNNIFCLKSFCGVFFFKYIYIFEFLCMQRTSIPIRVNFHFPSSVRG